MIQKQEKQNAMKNIRLINQRMSFDVRRASTIAQYLYKASKSPDLRCRQSPTKINLRRTIDPTKFSNPLQTHISSCKGFRKFQKYEGLQKQCFSIIHQLKKAKTGFKNGLPILSSIQQEKPICMSDKRTCNSESQNSSQRLKRTVRYNKKVQNIRSKYYIQNFSKALITKETRVLDHFSLKMKILKNLNKLRMPRNDELSLKTLELPIKQPHLNKKTLFIDIDETIVHCNTNPQQPYDISISHENRKGVIQNLFIKVRPYALSFLRKISKHYQVISFTASSPAYADAIIDMLDPNKEYISHRIYRNSCIKISDEIYVKDLSIVNRNLKNCLIVDNAPYSYAYQIQNGIPILPYTEGEDRELMDLEKYLMELLKFNDVREMNKKHFMFEQYENYKNLQEIVHKLYKLQSSL